MPRLRDAGARRQAASALGWAVLVLALVSPPCNLSVALFSARVAQHLLLILVAAPLIAFGMIGPDRQRALRPAAPAALFALALWAWHLPVSMPRASRAFDLLGDACLAVRDRALALGGARVPRVGAAGCRGPSRRSRRRCRWGCSARCSLWRHGRSSSPCMRRA